MSERIPFRTNIRETVGAFMVNFGAELALTNPGYKLQYYPGRPASIFPPTAFVNRFRERLEGKGSYHRQRRPQCEVVVLHGLFDSAEAAAQSDRFVDGLLEYVETFSHAAGPNSLLEIVLIDDDPSFVADWLAPERVRLYYATKITFEGFVMD